MVGLGVSRKRWLSDRARGAGSPWRRRLNETVMRGAIIARGAGVRFRRSDLDKLLTECRTTDGHRERALARSGRLAKG